MKPNDEYRRQCREEGEPEEYLCGACSGNGCSECSGAGVLNGHTQKRPGSHLLPTEKWRSWS